MSMLSPSLLQPQKECKSFHFLSIKIKFSQKLMLSWSPILVIESNLPNSNSTHKNHTSPVLQSYSQGMGFKIPIGSMGSN
uniref:Uncharacterized protein n=1 Tax=Rhizophora mucronata TaxID=61149 RepID=A0A2P2LWD7_RHIMU